MTTQLRPGELEALLDEILGPRPLPKPKLVVTETRNADGKPEVIRDADVIVSRDDPNARKRGSERVTVRAPDPEWLRLKPTAEEEQIIAANRARMANARLRKEADPFRYGHWSNPND